MSGEAEQREPMMVERDGWDDIYGAALDVVDPWLPDGAEPADAIPRWLLVAAINAAVDCAGVKPANHAHHRTKRNLHRTKRKQERQGQRIANAKAERDEALAELARLRSLAAIYEQPSNRDKTFTFTGRELAAMLKEEG